jgi:Fic family protein
MVPGPMTLALGGIDAGRGREEAFREQHPEALKTLTKSARVQSTEASNAIEQVTAPRKRVEALVAGRTAPANRSEQEIAGYRAALDTIHSSALQIVFKPSVVEQLHRDLYQFTNVPAGRWKTVGNSIEETLPDGTTAIRFETVAPADTPAAMEELHERFLAARGSGDHHPLLLLGCYVFDFLAIHPFRDGNGRMSRLLTLLLLYQSGYEVGRYISLERIISDSKETYYDVLQAAGRGWHTDQHDIKPWLNYLLGTFTAAYGEFEQRVGTVGVRGAKSAAIKQFIRSSISDEFTVSDVRQAAPGASDSYISKTLAKLRDDGIIESLGTGRSARWRRLRDDF